MALKLIRSNLKLAERALTHYVRSLAAVDSIITTQSTTNPRFLVSLRSFASGGSPEKQPPPPSSPPPPKQEEAEQPNNEDNSDPTDNTNPVMDALRASIQEQIIQLKSQSTMTEQIYQDHLPWWQRSIVEKFGAWVQTWYEDFLKARVEKEFELQEFLEGSKDAFWMVHQLIGEEDYISLKTMVSSKLLDAVETTGKEYRSGGLVWRTEIDENVPLDAQLRRISFWSGEQIAEYDPEEAAKGGKGRWLVMWVSYKAAQHTLITREDDGHVVAKLTDKRPALWTFAAGPLPESVGKPDGPPAKLEVPFWLLKFG
jgi:hypothetical protein